MGVGFASHDVSLAWYCRVFVSLVKGVLNSLLPFPHIFQHFVLYFVCGALLEFHCPTLSHLVEMQILSPTKYKPQSLLRSKLLTLTGSQSQESFGSARQRGAAPPHGFSSLLWTMDDYAFNNTSKNPSKTRLVLFSTSSVSL